MSDKSENLFAFDGHLDVCRQCHDHPFALCPVGEVLLRETAEAALRVIETGGQRT